MAKKGKRIKNLKEKVEAGKFYTLADACELTTQLASAKFDETVEVAISLGVDPRKADQNVRGGISLPHGLGKQVRVAVFAKAEKAQEAKEAALKDSGLTEEEFNDPDMMIQVGKIGKILGPKGLMPSPKDGTVTFDVANMVTSLKKGRVSYRADKAGIVHAPVGKVSFGAEKIADNIKALVDALNKAKPATSKGVYLKAISMSLTMGPSVALDVANVKASL